MKKIVICLLMTILLTGCTAVRINTNSIDNIWSVVLSKDNDLYNRVGKGYKYYVPGGVSYIDTNDLNEKLYADGSYYYLYIDAISYYYKKEFSYTEKTDLFYSKAIDINNKKGYLEITKQADNNYYIQFMYNYAKIEAIVSKEDINLTVLNASYILSTVKFNDNVIALMLDSSLFTSKEEVYDIFTVKENTDYFLKVADDSDTPSTDEEGSD